MAGNSEMRLIKAFEQVEAGRTAFSDHWQEISDVTSPARAVFKGQQPNQGAQNVRKIYDTTGTHANELLSSGFFSLLTSPTVPWFQFLTTERHLNDDRETALWLSEVSKIMGIEIQKPQTGFTTAMHEFYWEYGAYGNGIMFVTERSDMSSLLFTTLPLAECFFLENDEGFVNTLIRRYWRTPMQLVERFGEQNVSPKVQEGLKQGRVNEYHEVLHFMVPKSMAAMYGIDMPFAFASIYMERQSKHILKTSGYNEQPFMAARFYKLPQEVYGRGPGSTALPDIAMLQEMSKTVIRGAQKMVDPPLQMPDQGFLSPPNTAPGRVNYFRANGNEADRIVPLLTGGRPDLGLDLMQSIQNRVREIFFVDQLQLNVGPQMTATEVLQRTEEKQRLMGPVIGRASTELLSPLLMRSFGLLLRAGKLPPMPAQLAESKARIKIFYTSPIFKAQEQVAANNIMRAAQVLMPFQGADPTIMDIIHPQRMAEGVSKLFNVDPEFLRTKEELAEVAEQRQQAQMMQQATALRDMGAGMSSMADASSTLNEQGMI